MALDIYYREDVDRALNAINTASEGPFALIYEEINRAKREGRKIDPDDLADKIRIYRMGHSTALNANAVAFGVARGIRLTEHVE